MLGLNYLAWLGILVWVVVPLAAWLVAWLVWRRSGAVLSKAFALAVGFAILSTPWLVSSGVKAHYDRQVRELCAKDGGVRVYETVRLTPDLIDKADRIWIPDKERAKPSDKYYYESEDRYYRQGYLNMLRMQHRIIRRSDGKVLGESIRYGRAGGDLPGPWHHSSFMCPDPVRQPSNFESSIFVKGEQE